MFVDWLIVLSSANQILWINDNQDIAKQPEADDPVVPVIMVEKLDGTIDCINIVFKEVVPAKPERVTRNCKSPHEKVRKKKLMHMLNMINMCFTWKVVNWRNSLWPVKGLSGHMVLCISIIVFFE